MTELTLSVSDLTTFQNCGYQYYLKYVKRVTVPKTLPLHIGTVMHWVLQRNYESIRDYGEPIPLDLIREMAIDAFEFRIEKEGFVSDPKDPDASKAKEMTAEISVAHAKYITPTVKPKLIEEYFKIPIPGREYFITGRVDCIEEDLTVRDTKSASMIPNIVALEYSDQLTVYAMAVNYKYNVFPKMIKQDYLIKDNDGTCRTLTMVTTRNKEHVNRLLRRIDVMFDAVQAGIYTPANASNQTCGYCGYKDQCPYFDPYSIKIYSFNETARKSIKKTGGKKKKVAEKKKSAKKKKSKRGK